MPERFDRRGYVQKRFTFEELENSKAIRNLRGLHDGLAPYLDSERLRQLVAEHSDLLAALHSDDPPAEVLALIDTLSALVRLLPREQIKVPQDVIVATIARMYAATEIFSFGEWYAKQGFSLIPHL